jgi:hypothetical protein
LFLTDKIPPEIVFCPNDIVEVMLNDDLSTEISWPSPLFKDDVGVVDIKQSHQPG